MAYHALELGDGCFPLQTSAVTCTIGVQVNVIAAQQAVPSGSQLLDQGFIYQEDYDHKHFPRLLWPFKEGEGAGKREESGELIKKEWLPLSLDLNPTEKVWDLLYLSKKRT